MTIREKLEERERQTLSPMASLSAESRGRQFPAEPCPIRTEYQRDRDRIIHSKSFRRLKHKTQVFLSPEGDHYRTRLTHTLEVSQIGRTIARALGLNEDLVEAAAMGHDIGHTPFGHAGEYALREICPLGFDHNEQSVRVAERLENDGKGLNLTWEVRDAIRCHSSGCPSAQTFEGRVLRYADKIAYINHDIEDALRGGVIYPIDIPLEVSQVLGFTHGERINALVVDAISASRGQDRICQSPQVGEAMAVLKEFMFANVYTNPIAKGEESKAQDMLKMLFGYYQKNPDELPADFQAIRLEEGVDRAVCDYIAGMTDPFAVSEYTRLFIPMGWGVK